MIFSVQKAEDALHYVFKNKNLLRQAFVHSSYANAEHISDNDRMEYLGDAILDYVVAELLYCKYSDMTAGDMSKLRAKVVSADGLQKAVRQLGILDMLMVSSGAQGILKQSKKLSANLYEAVLCAIYFDGGMDQARLFVERTLADYIDNASQLLEQDYCTQLQEYCQENKITFKYSPLSKSGPDHSPVFTYELVVDGKVVAKGEGKNIKQAKANTAKIYLERRK